MSGPTIPGGSPGADGGSQVATAVAEVRARIEAACRRSGRSTGEVTLVGATKAVPVAVIGEAMAAGLTVFAENYVAELRAKAEALPEARWHFIGRLQTGTVGKLSDLVEMVQSAEPGTALSKLARRADSSGLVVPCLAQVDFTSRRQGVKPNDVPAFLTEASDMKGIRLTGLMTVPPLAPDPEGARPYFARLRELRDTLLPAWPDLQELSMGMSADFEIGVEEGATMVRVGTALFGSRPKKAPRVGSRPIRPGPDDL